MTEGILPDAIADRKVEAENVVQELQIEGHNEVRNRSQKDVEQPAMVLRPMFKSDANSELPGYTSPLGRSAEAATSR